MAEYAIGGLTPEQREDLADSLLRRSIEAEWSDAAVIVPDAAAYVVTGLVDQARRGALVGVPLPAPPNSFSLGPGGTGGPGRSGYPPPGPWLPTGPMPGPMPGPMGGPMGMPPAGYGVYGPIRKTNGLAVAALVLGLGSLVACPLLAIGGLICGYRGRSRAFDGEGEGAGMALTGIILSWIGMAITIGAVFVYGGLIAFVVASPTTSSRHVPPVTRSGTSTSVPFSTTTVPRTGGSTAKPSGVIPIEQCRRVTLAARNLTVVTQPDRGILVDAASSLRDWLPASSRDDIDSLLADALTRVDHTNTGPPPADVVLASNRVNVIVADACPG